MNCRRTGILLSTIVGMAFTGCTGGFEKNWRGAASHVSRDPYEGRWEGKWRSQKHRNGEGRLRCILTSEGPNRYQAKFKADWMIFSSTYTTPLDVVRGRRKITFRGRKDLGALYGGVYTFEGRATPGQFTAAYDSSYDTGTFEMGKVSEVSR